MSESEMPWLETCDLSNSDVSYDDESYEIGVCCTNLLGVADVDRWLEPAELVVDDCCWARTKLSRFFIKLADDSIFGLVVATVVTDVVVLVDGFNVCL